MKPHKKKPRHRAANENTGAPQGRLNARPDSTLPALRFQRHCEKIHALGPRVFAEMLREISAEHSCMLEIERTAQRYAALTPAAEHLLARGIDIGQFPPPPLHEVVK